MASDVRTELGADSAKTSTCRAAGKHFSEGWHTSRMASLRAMSR
jgi:hypothetical protein